MRVPPHAVGVDESIAALRAPHRRLPADRPAHTVGVALREIERDGLDRARHDVAYALATAALAEHFEDLARLVERLRAGPALDRDAALGIVRAIDHRRLSERP